jgi:uncharacterized protein
MHPLIEYQIPVKGLKSGSHSFVFQVDESFFYNFQNTILERGQFKVTLVLEKRPEMMLMQFDMDGFMETECDRCLVPIKLPIHQTHEMIVKFEQDLDVDDIDVIFLPPETNHFDISNLVYELLLLSVPMIKTYNCEDDNPPPCNQSMLKHLYRPANAKDDGEQQDPTWDILKDIN